MFNRADLPDRLPIFPLPGAVLLPRGNLPLNIFEPRYLTMLDEVLKTPHRLIGMVQPIAPSDATSEAPRLHQIGCAGRVIVFSELENRRYRITLAGKSRFRIKSVDEGFAPYLSAEVEWNGFERDMGQEEKDADFDRADFLNILGKFLQSSGLRSDWASLKNADDELLVNSLSMMFPFETEDKQALLEAPTLSDRRETLLALMEFAMAGSGDAQRLQ